MKIIVIVSKLEQRLRSENSEDVQYRSCIQALFKKLQQQDPNTIFQYGGECEYTGDHYPVDDKGDIHFDKKRFFRKGQEFPDDDFIWIPTP